VGNERFALAAEAVVDADFGIGRAAGDFKRAVLTTEQRADFQLHVRGLVQARAAVAEVDDLADFARAERVHDARATAQAGAHDAARGAARAAAAAVAGVPVVADLVGRQTDPVAEVGRVARFRQAVRHARVADHAQPRDAD